MQVFETSQNMSQTVTSYDEMLLKQKIAPILSLEVDGPWEIVSQLDDLVMVHYTSNHKTLDLSEDMKKYAALRGVVIDIKTNTIVCASYPHAQRVMSSSLIVTENELVLNNDKLNLEDVIIKTGFEGTLMHVFKFNGKVYRVTRKRLDPSKSRWGNSKKFGEIYVELNGPKDEELFDPTKNYSPYVHTFILVHPDLLISSRDYVQKGFLVYLGAKKMYEENSYPVDEVDTELHIPLMINYMNDSDGKHALDGTGKIYYPHPLNLAQANKHLMFGFYDSFPGYENLDSRMLPGEFIIVEDKNTHKMYKVESPAYVWRTSLRNNNPNLKHQFFELLDYVSSKVGDEKYKYTFLPLMLYDYNSLVENINKEPIIVWSNGNNSTSNDILNRDGKIYQIWENFLLAVPLCKQAEVVTYLPFLIQKREEVITWLKKLSDINNLDATKFSKRVQDILLKTKMFAQKNQNRNKKDIRTLTHDNIQNFIYKELGSSLYRLIREMTQNQEQNQNYNQEQAQEQNQVQNQEQNQVQNQAQNE